MYEEDVMKSKSKNLSADVQTDRTFVDDAMFFHMDEADYYFAIGDVPCAIDNNVVNVDYSKFHFFCFLSPLRMLMFFTLFETRILINCFEVIITLVGPLTSSS